MPREWNYSFSCMLFLYFSFSFSNECSNIFEDKDKNFPFKKNKVLGIYIYLVYFSFFLKREFDEKI